MTMLDTEKQNQFQENKNKLHFLHGSIIKDIKISTQGPDYLLPYYICKHPAFTLHECNRRNLSLNSTHSQYILH